MRERELKVLEWPQDGAARRYPVGGWWVLEVTRPPDTYLPVAGPYRVRETAELALDTAKLIDAAQSALPWLVRLGNYIGNGTDEDPTGRCDAILAIKTAIDDARARHAMRERSGEVIR